MRHKVYAIICSSLLLWSCQNSQVQDESTRNQSDSTLVEEVNTDASSTDSIEVIDADSIASDTAALSLSAPVEIDLSDPFIKDELSSLLGPNDIEMTGLSLRSTTFNPGVHPNFGQPDGGTPGAKPNRSIQEVVSDYLMEVKADSTLDQNDYLDVSWSIFIPEDGHVPEDLPDQVETWKQINATLGNYVTIEIDAPDFELPENIDEIEKKCIRLTTAGANSQFKIKPKRTGKLLVSVTASVYENESCMGASVPISTETLDIEVRVNHIGSIWDAIDGIITSFITETANFVTAIIGVVFAFLLFRFRKKLFGKDDPEGNTPAP